MGDQALFERLFSRIIKWVRIQNLMSADLETITIYHDDPEAVPAEEQRISVGVTVPKGTKPDGDIQIMEIPPGDFVVGSFEIDPEDYGLAWQQVIEWIMNHKMDFLLDPMYESYRNNPHEHPEGKHLVDICVPIETY
jgi:AraC family transcriptional regulator